MGGRCGGNQAKMEELRSSLFPSKQEAVEEVAVESVA